ncbi:WhiB family transcriptional regulator [Streptomyces termitum]|uniref:WhiB family transcriptional regulator n=1 Tax=Streptomyces termitum TaxID=67368 RepID=UPI0033B5A0CA
MSPPDPTPWQAAAACAGLSPSVVFARRERQAAPALRACAVCPVLRECEEAVAPAESWFDGVCAGRVWRNGRPVTPRSSRKGGGVLRTTAGRTGAAGAEAPVADAEDAFDAFALAARLDAAGLALASRAGGRRG